MRLKALWGAVPLAVLAAIIAVAVPGGAASTWDPAGTSSSPHSLTNLDDIVVESSDGDVWFVGGHQNQINKLIADDIDVLNHLGSDRLVVNNYIMEYVSSDSDLNHILNEINALKPQVDVDIISEASLTGSTQNAFFNNITRSNTPVWKCSNGCASSDSDALNHAKFYMIDQNNDNRYIWVTSANINDTPVEVYDVAIRINAKVGGTYGDMWDWFEDLADEHMCAAGNTAVCSSPAPAASIKRGDVKIWHASPNPPSDPQEIVLDNIAEGLDNYTGSNPPKADCNVKISVGTWPDNTQVRNDHFFDILKDDIAAESCNVKVITQSTNTYSGSGISDLGIETQTNAHAKMIVLDGPYNNTGTWREYVFLGSQNFTQKALDLHDELWVKIEGINAESSRGGTLAEWAKLYFKYVNLTLG